MNETQTEGTAWALYRCPFGKRGCGFIERREHRTITRRWEEKRYNHALGVEAPPARKSEVTYPDKLPFIYCNCPYVVKARERADADWQLRGYNISPQWIRGRYNEAVTCNAKCMAATRDICECSCAGENHGGKYNVKAVAA